ncbi:MAG: T9SS type A sorting domain-containing protein [Bacteroidia bacterium]
MKKILLIIIIAGSSLIATAQTYTISPSSTVNETALCNQFNAFYIYQNNVSVNTLNLGWTFISNNLPSGWGIQFCDNFNCYSWPNIPATGTMTPVVAGGQASTSLDVTAATAGSGTFIVYVYDIANPTNGDTLTYIVTSDCPTGIADQSQDNSLSVFPNPVIDYLNITSDKSSSIEHLFIYNSFGQQLYEKTISGSEFKKIDVSHYSPGLYMLVIKDENGKQTSKSFVK